MVDTDDELIAYYENYCATLIKRQNANIEKIEEKSRNEVEKEERKNNCYYGGNIMYNHNSYGYGCNNVSICNSGTRSTIPF